MIERLPDPVGHEELWQPPPGAVRFDFETSSLMRRAGIDPDTTLEADARYFELIEELAQEIGEAAELRAAGHRSGPLASGDFAFIDLIVRAV